TTLFRSRAMARPGSARSTTLRRTARMREVRRLRPPAVSDPARVPSSDGTRGFAALRTPMPDVVEQRIHAGGRHVRVVREVALRREPRTGVAPFGGSLRQVVVQGIR